MGEVTGRARAELELLTTKSRERFNGSTVYHYTDGTGLLGILDKAELWASTSESMNDEQEIEAGLRLIEAYLCDEDANLHHRAMLKDALSKARADHANGATYITSASIDKDSLSMWRGYGGQGEISYAIGLDPSVDFEVIKSPRPSALDASKLRLDRMSALARELALAPVVGWLKVSYDDDATKKRIKRIVHRLDKSAPILQGQLWDDFSPNFLMNIAFATKAAGFKDEREVRLVVRPHPAVEVMNFRSGRYSITNYVRLAAAASRSNEWGMTIDKPDHRMQLPIRSIHVGPTRYPDQAVRSVKRLLDSYGYHDAQVFKSDVPFR